MAPTGDVDSSPPGLLWVMRGSAGLIATLTVVAGLVGFLAALQQADRYRATVRLHISYPYEGSDAPRDPQRRLDDLAARITSVQVLDRAAEALGDQGPSAQELSTRVTAQPSQALDIIDVHAVDPSPEHAGLIANVVASAFQEVSVEARVAAAQEASTRMQPIRDQLRARIDAANRRMSEIRAATEAEVPASNLRAQAVETRLAADSGYQASLAERDAAIEELRELGVRSQVLAVEAAAQGSEIDLVEPARTSRRPISPRPVRAALLTGLVGLLASTSVLWLRVLKRSSERGNEGPATESDLGIELEETSGGRRVRPTA